MKKLGFIFILAILVSCKTHLHVPDNDEQKLQGKWRWIETSGGFAGQVSTPATENYKMSIEFLSNGILKEYKNGEFINKCNYTVEKGKSIYVADGEVLLINYIEKNADVQQRVRDYFEIKGKDTLILKNECYDCFTKLFVRER